MHADAPCWIDGELRPLADATVPVLSNAVFRGTTVFDVLLVEYPEGCPHAVGLSRHLERLQHSIDRMGMRTRWSDDELTAAIATVVAGQPPNDEPGHQTIVRIAALWDGDVAGAPISRDAKMFVLASPAIRQPLAPIAATVATARIPPEVLPPQLKAAAAYAPGVRAELDAREAGFDRVVNRGPDGNLLEGVSSSVGVVAGERLLLPPLSDVLDSVTRRLIVDLADHASIDVAVEPVPWSTVLGAEALFASSSTRPIVPIERLDEHPFRADHPLVRRLADDVGALFRGQHALGGEWLTRLDR